MAVDAPSIFGSALPDPQADPTLLAHPALISNETCPAGPISKEDHRFFRYLRDVSRFPIGPATDTAVDDFCACLLQTLEYDEPDRVIHHHMELDLIMCGHQVTARPDLVIMGDRDYILVVQRYMWEAESEPRLIAAAIAAHYENNRRRYNVGRPTVAAKIPVSEALVEAVSRGHYPSEATVVKKLVPPVDDMRNYLERGMELLANRQPILQCLGAFRQFVV
ncbi:hypothetical protein B0H12DRAFT_48721 [Mycena haematopus]|nr:hypothetical protein B0H12DRAFT_48721 [Mycena haematopus]